MPHVARCCGRRHWLLCRIFILHCFPLTIFGWFFPLLPLFLPELISRRRQATKDSDKLRLIGIFMYIRCAYVSVSVSAVIAVVIAVSIAVAVARVMCRQLRRSCLKK